MQFLAGLAAVGLIAGAAALPQQVDAKSLDLTTTTETKTKTTVSKTTTTLISSLTQTIVSTSTETDQATATITKTAKSTVTVGGASCTVPASTVTAPASTVTLAAQTVTVTAPASTVTAPASTVTAPASTVTVTVSGSSTISGSSSKTLSSTSTTGFSNSTSTSVGATSYTGPVYLEYTATPVSAVKQAQATALTSSPTSNVEGEVFDRFVIIWLENTDYAAAASDPNLAALAAQGLTLSQNFGVTHPSEPNYMASHGGDYFGLDGDGLTYVDSSVSSVFDLLDTAGISWSEYQEDMPYSGFEGYQYQSVYGNATHNDYVRKHNPGVLYNSASNSPQRLSQMKNFTQFYVDLENNALPQWMFLTPNMTNDGHDTSVTTAGSWSKSFLEPLLTNPNFNGPKTLILLTFDENHTYTIANNVFSMLLGNAVPQSLIGTTDSSVYTHYSQIATVSANWNLPTLGRWDVGANVYDFIGQQTGDAIKPWTTNNGTWDTFPGFAFNASYPGPFNSKINNTGYPVPNTSAVRNGRAVLPLVQSTFAGKSSSYYPGNVGPMLYDGEVGNLPPTWY